MSVRWIFAMLLLFGGVGTASAEPLTSTDKVVATFMELDGDLSESVSFQEYMTMVQERAKNRFIAMDANGDQQVTADEYREFWTTQKAKWYRLNK